MGVVCPEVYTPCALNAGIHMPTVHCTLGYTNPLYEQNDRQTGVKTLPSRNFLYRRYKLTGEPLPLPLDPPMKSIASRNFVAGKFTVDVPGLYSCSLKVDANFYRTSSIYIARDTSSGNHEIICRIFANPTDSCSRIVRLSRGDNIYLRAGYSAGVVSETPETSIFECRTLLVDPQWRNQ